MNRSDQIHDTEFRWFAVYTKSKCEKQVRDNLLKKDIQTYLPTLKKTRKYASKVRHVEFPLIPSYVFVRINKSLRITVLQTQNVIQFLKLHGKLIAIREEEINILKQVVGEKVVERISNQTLQEGTPVEILAGNLTGLKGHIVKKQNKKYFLVRLESIGYTLELNIADNMMKALEVA